MYKNKPWPRFNLPPLSPDIAEDQPGNNNQYNHQQFQLLEKKIEEANSCKINMKGEMMKLEEKLNTEVAMRKKEDMAETKRNEEDASWEFYQNICSGT